MICMALFMALFMDLLMDSIYGFNLLDLHGFNLWIYLWIQFMDLHGFNLLDLHGFNLWIYMDFSIYHNSHRFSCFFCLCFFVLFCMRSIMSPDVSDDRGTCE